MTKGLTLEQKKAYYDKVKMDNFKASCRLEGIDLDEPISQEIKELIDNISRTKENSDNETI